MNVELTHIRATKILGGNSDLENPGGTELIIDLEVDRLFILPATIHTQRHSFHFYPHLCIGPPCHHLRICNFYLWSDNVLNLHVFWILL